MLNNDDRYRPFGLVTDMLATTEIIRQFDVDQADDTAGEIAEIGRLLMTGEGSSRIFPAKNAMTHARRHGYSLQLHTEAGMQAREYDLHGWAVFALSNSGRTAEVIRLFTALKSAGHSPRYSLTAFADTTLQALADQGYVLSCGAEGAVAATKSVMEQALFYRALLEAIEGKKQLGTHLAELSDSVQQALTMPIDAEIISRIASAKTIYWAGRTDGVADELTLKTNEITRNRADYLEGT